MEVFSSFLAYDQAGGNYNKLHMGVDIVSNGENVYCPFENGSFMFVNNGKGWEWK